jgi:tetratricopeptide (TPR) repeat protein
MKKKGSLLIQLLIFSLVIIAGGIFIYNRNQSHKINASKFIYKVKEVNKSGLDSLQNSINYERDLNHRIEQSIYNRDFNTAYTLMDSLPAFGKTNSIHLYKGMIHAELERYPEAIEEYSIVIDAEPFPIALDKRAKVYIKTKQLEFALNDYKRAYLVNYDYSLQVATTFELTNKKDSALKYFQIYLEHYPTDTAVQQKIKDLLFK